MHNLIAIIGVITIHTTIKKTLIMRHMKLTIFSISTAIILLLLSCNNNDSSSKKEKKGKTTEKIAEKEIKTATGATINLTKEKFLEQVMDFESNPSEWIYLGDKPCLIDFYADWCAPCKMTNPILEELAKEYEGKIIIYKVNTEYERELSALFGIQSIPTFLYCPMEGKPTLMSGIAKSKEATKQMFKDNIDKLLLNQ